MSTNLKLLKWIRWIDILYNEVIHLFANKAVFNRVQEIIINNPKIQKPSAFYEYYGINYGISALMTIRRLLEPNKYGISFYELLSDIYNNNNIITRDYYRSLYGNHIPEYIKDKDFDKFSGNNNQKNFLDKKIIEADLKAINKTIRNIKYFVDKKVAHLDKTTPKKLLTFKEVEDCIEFIGNLLKKYLLILKAANLFSPEPTFQYDWDIIFTEKWIP